MPLAPGPRAGATVAFEAQREVERILEAHAAGDDRHRFLGKFEQLPRPVQPLQLEVALRGLPGLGAEEMGEARRRESALGGDARDIQRLGEPLADKVERAADAAVEPGRLPARIGEVAP